MVAPLITTFPLTLSVFTATLKNALLGLTAKVGFCEQFGVLVVANDKLTGWDVAPTVTVVEAVGLVVKVREVTVQVIVTVKVVEVLAMLG